METLKWLWNLKIEDLFNINLGTIEIGYKILLVITVLILLALLMLNLCNFGKWCNTEKKLSFKRKIFNIISLALLMYTTIWFFTFEDNGEIVAKYDSTYLYDIEKVSEKNINVGGKSYILSEYVHNLEKNNTDYTNQVYEYIEHTKLKTKFLGVEFIVNKDDYYRTMYVDVETFNILRDNVDYLYVKTPDSNLVK